MSSWCIPLVPFTYRSALVRLSYRTEKVKLRPGTPGGPLDSTSVQRHGKELELTWVIPVSDASMCTDDVIDSIPVELTQRMRHGQVHENLLLLPGRHHLAIRSIPLTFILVLRGAVLQPKETRDRS